MIKPHEIAAVQWFAATTGAIIMPHEVPAWLRLIADEATDIYTRNCVEMYAISRSTPIDQQHLQAALRDSRMPGDLVQPETPS